MSTYIYIDSSGTVTVRIDADKESAADDELYCRLEDARAHLGIELPPASDFELTSAW